jgi:hypothetical protein
VFRPMARKSATQAKDEKADASNNELETALARAHLPLKVPLGDASQLEALGYDVIITLREDAA